MVCVLKEYYRSVLTEIFIKCFLKAIFFDVGLWGLHIIFLTLESEGEKLTRFREKSVSPNFG